MPTFSRMVGAAAVACWTQLLMYRKQQSADKDQWASPMGVAVTLVVPDWVGVTSADRAEGEGEGGQGKNFKCCCLSNCLDG